ncbi:hypothetical protein Tco_0679719, partial [Tanacetum coccineum]
FRRRPTTKGVGLRMADSHTGNHPKDGFTPLEIIQRLLVVIWRRSYSGFEREAFEPERMDVKVILPKKSHTVLDAPLGYIGLYTHHFSLSNLRLPIPLFKCEVLNYFKVHISHFNPFGMVKLTTFAVMGSAYVPKALLKPITHLGNWKDSFFFIENKIIPSDYLELLLGENKLDKQSFKDKDPILYLAGLKTTWKHSPKRHVIYHRGQEMDFRSFMLEGVDGEFNFLPAEGVSKGQNSPSAKSVNNDALVIGDIPLSSVYPLNIVENVADSDDHSYGVDEQTLGGLSLPPYLEASKKLKILSKRKVASGVPRKALPPKVQKVSARASKVAGEAYTPLDVDGDSNIHEFPSAKELRDATDCHWVVAYFTPPSWKQQLRERSIEQLCDIYDKAYMRQAVLDNVLNNRTRELIFALHKAKTSYDAIRARELDKDMAYAKLERKCNEALQDLDKNPLISDMRVEIKVFLKQDRAAIVSKVIPDTAMKLVRSDDLEVDAMKEPYVLEKMSGYRPSSKEENDQAGDALENALYPFLAEYVVNPYASLEQLLSKKPPSL